MARFPGDLVEHSRAFAVLSAEIDLPGAGAFERAARKLHLDPSVLRRRLQTLVDYTGGDLVRGRGRELQLTPQGARVRVIAAELVDRARAMHTLQSAPERIVIGCTEAVSSELLPTTLSTLRRRLPSLSIVVRRLGTEECVARLVAGEVDLGVVRGAPNDPRWPRELDATMLGRDRLWIAVPRRHRLERARAVRLRDVATEPSCSTGRRPPRGGAS